MVGGQGGPSIPPCQGRGSMPRRGDRGPHKIKDFVGWFTGRDLARFSLLASHQIGEPGGGEFADLLKDQDKEKG